MTEKLTPAAKAYLARLRAWALSDGGKEPRAAYWTEERREAHAEKLRAYWTPERRANASGNRNPRVPRGLVRIVPKLPDAATVWRSSKQRGVYHLRRDCPTVGPHGKLNKGRFGAMKASGRRLCYYESFHWKKGGA